MPPPFVIATFALDVLTVPLLYFRHNGCDRGRMGFGEPTPSSYVSSSSSSDSSSLVSFSSTAC